MSGDEFLKKIMKMEKVESPQRWAEKYGIDWMTLPVWKAQFCEKKFKLPERLAVITPSKNTCFFELFELFEPLGLEYKIYPIMDGKHMVVEIDGRRRNKGESREDDDGEFLYNEVSSENTRGIHYTV